MEKFFDWEYYISRHADLPLAGINTKELALLHYNLFGQKEGRLCHKLDVPPNLRLKVTGVTDEGAHMVIGEKCCKDIIDTVSKHLILGKNTKILDFGVGCGRVLQFMMKNSNLALSNLYGVDVDAEAINFIKNVYPKEVNLSVSGHFPPLTFEANTFDLVYAISVFTHLNDHLIGVWLDEMYRVVKKNGYLLFTTHDAKNKDDHISFSVPKAHKEMGFPAYYGVSYTSKDYISTKITQSKFTLVEYVSKGLSENQDIYLVKNNKN